MGSGGIAPHVPKLWRWVVSFTPQPLYPWRKSPWYPFDRWTTNLVWSRQNEKNVCPCWNWNLVIHPV